MSAAYIDETYIASFLGLDVLQALFTTPTVSYSSTQLGVVINGASAVVQSQAQRAGYTIGDTTTSDIVKLATFAEFLKMAPANRKGITIGEKFVAQFGGLCDAIGRG